MNSEIKTYLENYSRSKARIDKARLLNCVVDTDSTSIKIYLNGGFAEQTFTPDIVDSIYSDIRTFIPDSIKSYRLSIITEDHNIEDLIPNYYRKSRKEHDQSRILQKEYSGKPWVTNASRPYRATKGLEGRHIALWASHGRYYKSSESQWSWQRPRLFCTNEDLLSQSFVVPYIIPMLQNAGAVVYTPRERDWQCNEVIVDNDTPDNGGIYVESYRSRKPKSKWQKSQYPGFANYKQLYEVCDTPFVDGTSRFIATTTSKGDAAYAQWIPDIPQAGRYAVYVSYRSNANSTNDACYKVRHKGGITEFHVNQKMGGGTWVYLGTFDFDSGSSEDGMVILSNISTGKGIISADAVRFGGGMGNVVPVSEESSIPQSGLPRWAEAAKYSTFWYGMPYSVHTERFGGDDYRNDINCRSHAVNHLAGGSMFNPDTTGLRVPLEATIAFHTDAGYHKEDDLFGSLAIYRTAFNNGKTGAGLDRYVSRDLSSMLLHNLQNDLAGYNWQIRQLWNRNYGEAREPVTPVCILEMLSHQNFADMQLAYDPHFRFDFCRSVYKTIVKFIATEHKSNYVIQPLPVHDFCISLNEAKNTAELSWADTSDPMEPSAAPLHYIVYTRIGNGAFDNGTLVKGKSHSVRMIPNVPYSFRVTALNLGGESFPSETLSAGISSSNEGTILIINGFTRLEGPAVINTETEAGFDLDTDPGIQYGAFTGFCGKQQCFTRSTIGRESSTGLGYSGDELEGQIVMGNTFDYPFLHGQAIMSTHHHSYTSAGIDALHDGKVNLSAYKILDVICGVQKQFDKKTAPLLDTYIQHGGKVLISGANISPIISQLKGVKTKVTSQLTDKNITTVSGSNTEFDIYRELNPESYCVPAPSELQAEKGSFAMLQYSNQSIAGVAAGNNSVVLGFPLESITEKTQLNRLMRGILKYLNKK